MTRKPMKNLVAASLAAASLLLGACSADKQSDSPTQPTIPGVDFPVAAAFACFAFVDQPGLISFEDRSTGAPTSFAWDFGDGRTSTAQHPKHQYAVSGGYIVTFTARDARTSSTVSALAVTDVGCFDVPVCGNGVVEFGEECDGGAGCNPDCTLAVCGNGVVDAGEACDDGNLVSGDGCQSNCTITP